jgi:hypothetical protein
MRGMAVSVAVMTALIAVPTSARAGTPAKVKPPTACARADDLAAAGETAAAKKAYVAMLTKAATPCATAGLKKLNAPKTPSVTDRASSLTSFLAGLAVPLIALFVVLSVVFVALTYSTPFRRRFRTVWGFQSSLRPRLAVKTFVDSGGTTDCAGVEAAVRAGLSRLSRAQEGPAGEYKLDTVSGVEGLESQVGKLGDVAPQFKSIAAIIGFAGAAARLPRYQLQGTLGERSGNDITVTLEDRGGIASAATLRTNPKDHVDPFGYLALVAGSWADYRIRQIEHLDLPSTTRSAESYGHFRAGVACEELSMLDEAENAYLDALGVDRENYGALVNLALLTSRRGEFATAIGLLEEAFRTIERQQP